MLLSYFVFLLDEIKSILLIWDFIVDVDDLKSFSL